MPHSVQDRDEFCTHLPSSALSAREPSHSISAEGPLLGLPIPPQSQLKSFLGTNKLWYLKTGSSCFTFLLLPSAKLRENKTNPGVCFRCRVSTNFGKTETCVFCQTPSQDWSTSWQTLFGDSLETSWPPTWFAESSAIFRYGNHLSSGMSYTEANINSGESMKEVTAKPVFMCNPSLPSS